MTQLESSANYNTSASVHSGISANASSIVPILFSYPISHDQVAIRLELRMDHRHSYQERALCVYNQSMFLSSVLHVQWFVISERYRQKSILFSDFFIFYPLFLLRLEIQKIIGNGRIFGGSMSWNQNPTARTIYLVMLLKLLAVLFSMASILRTSNI